MAIALLIQFEGLGSEKYDAVQEALGLAGNSSDWPEGIISHLAGGTAQGWCVVDLWESQESFDRFFTSRLKPAFDKVGGLPEPKITAVKVHNVYRHG